MMKTGELIKKLRTEKGITKSELARRSQVSMSYISLLESNKRGKISVFIADRIANALDVTLDEFMSRL